MHSHVSARSALCLLTLAVLAAVAMASSSSSVSVAPPPAKVKETTFTGTVLGMRQDNKLVAYSIRAKGTNDIVNVRMTEGGDKIKALVGEPAEFAVTITATGTTYVKQYPEGAQVTFMILKSVSVVSQSAAPAPATAKDTAGKDTAFAGTVCVIRQDNKVAGYSLRSKGNELCFIRMTEGGDKIKALVGEPAEGKVTVEATGTTYIKQHPEGARSLFMIVKSVKKL
jgi:hypothetical protein